MRSFSRAGWPTTFIAMIAATVISTMGFSPPAMQARITARNQRRRLASTIAASSSAAITPVTSPADTTTSRTAGLSTVRHSAAVRRAPPRSAAVRPIAMTLSTATTRSTMTAPITEPPLTETARWSMNVAKGPSVLRALRQMGSMTSIRRMLPSESAPWW